MVQGGGSKMGGGGRVLPMVWGVRGGRWWCHKGVVRGGR